MLDRNLARALFLGTVGVLALSTNPSIASPAVTSWDVASEFTEAGFANYGGGVWSYGEETTLNGVFTPLSTSFNQNAANIVGWMDSGGTGYPFIAHNVNQTTFNNGSFTIPPHGLQIHPGFNCEYAVIRFTAPAAGTYKVSGQFFGLDDNGYKTTTDGNISINGNPPIYTGNVDLNTASQHYASFTVQGGIGLALGDTIDFQVGCGNNGAYNYDSTGLNAVIEAKFKRHK